MSRNLNPKIEVQIRHHKTTDCAVSVIWVQGRQNDEHEEGADDHKLEQFERLWDAGPRKART